MQNKIKHIYNLNEIYLKSKRSLLKGVKCIKNRCKFIKAPNASLRRLNKV